MGGRSRRLVVLCAATIMLAAACGSGDTDGEAAGSIQDDIVVSQAQIDDAIAERDADEQPEVAVAPEADPPPEESDDENEPTTDETDEIEVTEADEDALDGLLNALNVFNSCLADEGYELDGFPGDDSGRTAEDFEEGYISALITCNTTSGITDALTSFGEANANLTAEEIKQVNFGSPTFKECLEDLGWEVGELIPDERGALGFGETGFEFTAPGGDSLSDFNTDDINACRLEAEQYVTENFEQEDG